MVNRRSIFKCIPAMIAAAVLPKSWTAWAAEPVDPIVEEYRKLGYEQTMAAHRNRITLVGETGPEIIRQTGPAIRVYNMMAAGEFGPMDWITK